MKYVKHLSLSELIDLIGSGKLSYEDLLKSLCDRYESVEPVIKAFINEPNRCERVFDDLKKLLEQHNSKSDRSPLFGIPVGIKDLFHMEGFDTLAGSKLPPESINGKEGALIKRLRELGVIFFGKTVTTEFAYFSPGPTVNPHNILHTPGGSSSGSAAAVAAGVVPLAFGTQTIGSISRPASFCGVVGFKPTYGRISTDGVVPFSSSVDHIGFFTQDLKGAEIAASLLCKNWNSRFNPSDTFTIGIPIGKYLIQASDKILEEFYRYITKLQTSGFDIVFVESFSNMEKINTLHNRLIAYEFAREHQKRYQRHKELFSSKSIELIEKGLIISGDEYSDIKKEKFKLTKEFEEFTKVNKIDLWLSPSAVGVAPKGISSTGNPVMNLPWTFFGFPTLSLPAGYIDDLPWNIQLAALQNEDEKLFLYAKDIYQDR